MKKVVLPEELETIPEGCFWKNKFETFDIPRNIRQIEKDAFSDCDALRAVQVPAGAEIATGAFEKKVRIRRYE